MGGWKQYVVRRKESVTTTWTFRLAVLVCLAGVTWGTRGRWIPGVGDSLVCDEEVGPADAILVDNSDQNYLAFERASALVKKGLAKRVVVPTQSDGKNPAVPNMVSAGIVDVMARVAWLPSFDVVPVRELEPITLNVAYQIREYATRHGIRSMLIAVSAYRSQRTMLIYQEVMRGAGVTVRCVPIGVKADPHEWIRSWHGVQAVFEQFMKLQYYRLYVLPFKAAGSPLVGATT